MSQLKTVVNDVARAFVKGKTVPVTLTFAKAGSVIIELAVGGIAASAPPGTAATPGDNSISGMKM